MDSTDPYNMGPSAGRWCYPGGGPGHSVFIRALSPARIVPIWIESVTKSYMKMCIVERSRMIYVINFVMLVVQHRHHTGTCVTHAHFGPSLCELVQAPLRRLGHGRPYANGGSDRPLCMRTAVGHDAQVHFPTHARLSILPQLHGAPLQVRMRGMHRRRQRRHCAHAAITHPRFLAVHHRSLA